MRNNRLLTGTLCAVLLAAMTACQAYIDTSAGSASTETVTAVVADSAETAEADSSDGDAASGNSGTTESVAETLIFGELKILPVATLRS